jgi:hypothetical protein
MKRAAMILGLMLVAAGCTPKVVVEVPKEPITFNINIKLDAEVRVVTRGFLQTGIVPSGRVPVDIRFIDLEELLPLFGVDGLDGTGMLGGTVPLRIANDKLAVSQGTLQADGAGRIRFAGPALQSHLAARPDTADTASKLLADFHYRKMTLRLDKPAGAIGTVMLHMEGSNPAALGGRPAVFNIRIESDYKNFITRCLPRRSEVAGSTQARQKFLGCGLIEPR